MQVIDLRNYQLQPGRRADFIGFFEEHFLDALGEHGMPVLGHFEVVNEPDRFYFMRLFPDMKARLRSLHSFYDSAYWHERRAAVNAMLVDSDRVHLVNPLDDVARLTAPRPPGLVVVDHHRVPRGELARTVEGLDRRAPGVLGTFVTELTPNDFPRHPVIQDPDLFIVMSSGTRAPGPEASRVVLKPRPRSRIQ